MAENTLQKIHEIASAEFLEKGFRGASLREIVKKAGVTTGAFYGYYKSKEELFSAMVKEPADYVVNRFKSLVEEFMQLPKEEWAKNMATYSKKGITQIYEYAFEHKDAFRLLLNASEGTEFGNFIHNLVEQEIEITHIFYKEMEAQGYKPYAFEPTLEHTIISGEFSALFELIVHDIPYEEGLNCAEKIHDFYEAGWQSVLKLN
ncbi:MAG: TetR/AcrR family transcriptional regulator [Treponema sp.]|uniref:TetR/AcrR family transcriptional regulator n=1 Tax=Treponema sp. TaxID=166 RepID=UPI0025D43F8F|nr:TetR/AcrR family transcriptional regulator [Treponema sp.]MBQ9624133.1 TetR/AcrR family transcriptional regulator [Treponema sp.]MBR0495347.1 TetR/AcrR family transcriptional regulator [Treponema sp.]